MEHHVVQNKHPLPERSELLKWLHYDPITGILSRIKDHKGRTDRLGPISYTNGRQKMIGTCGKQYITARIIWRIMTGEDPGQMEIDHKNLDVMDDRWENLRLATSTQNMANTPLRKDNRTGYKGIRFRYNRKGKIYYYARVRKNGVSYKSKLYDKIEDAVIEYEKLATIHYGEYKRTASHVQRRKEASGHTPEGG